MVQPYMVKHTWHTTDDECHYKTSGLPQTLTNNNIWYKSVRDTCQPIVDGPNIVTVS